MAKYLILKVYNAVIGASIDDMEEIFRPFGTLKLIASELIATTNPYDIAKSTPLYEEDDYLMANGYNLLNNDNKLQYVEVHYGNNTKKITNIRIN